MIPLLIVFIFCVGACLGSFFNALVSRFGSEKNWSPLSRSRCDVCDHRLGVLDLIPILSFLTFCRGRCRFCGRPIPAYYPVIELLTGLLCVGLVLSVLQPLHFPPLIDPNSVVSVSLLYSFVMIFFLATLFDYQYQAIPKSLIMTILVLGLVSIADPTATEFWIIRVIGGVVGFLLMTSQYLITRGKGLGSGDIFLTLSIGFFLGWKLLLVAIFFTYALGSLFGLFLVLNKKASGKRKIPLAPFLFTGLLISLVFGSDIARWYLSLL